MNRILALLILTAILCASLPAAAAATEVFINGSFFDDGRGATFGFSIPAEKVILEIVGNGSSLDVGNLQHRWHMYSLNVGLDFNLFTPYAGLSLINEGVAEIVTDAKLDGRGKVLNSRNKVVGNIGVRTELPLLGRLSFVGNFVVFPYFEGVGYHAAPKLSINLKDGASARIGYSWFVLDGNTDYSGLELGLNFVY